DALPEAQASTVPPDPGPVRVWLGRGASVRLDRGSQPLSAEELRALGVNIERIVQTPGPLPAVPEVDGGFYRRRAAGHTGNAGTNAAAGKFLGDDGLARKDRKSTRLNSSHT